MSLLTFGNGNAKLSADIFTFSLPAGYTCPGAKHCLAFADRKTGKITDGSEQLFRCFSASSEARLPQVRASRWRNFELLKAAGSAEGMTELIEQSLVPGARLVRIHVSGDFFSDSYFLAWCRVAESRPFTRFYAYTKSVEIWRRHLERIPVNLILTASLGGRDDESALGLKTARVVRTEEEAAAFNLPLDHDDSHAYEGAEDFALLIHGTQRAGTSSALALSALRSNGFTGYGRKAA